MDNRIDINSSLRVKGSNPTTTSTDTTTQWISLGSGIWYISENGVVKNQNFQYGMIINVALTSNDVFQIWNTQPYGNVLYRCGNGSGNNGGWYINWTSFSPGTATTAQVLKGYTFSSAAGSNLTGTYDPGDQYNSGYNAGYSAGNSTGYNNGYNAGKNDMLPNVAYLESWTRDSTDAGSWTCNVSGYYVIFVYGMVNAVRNMIPSVSINGTYISNHDAATADNDHRHIWIYQINSGSTVSWSWNTNHGTYYWRNGVAIIRIK